MSSVNLVAARSGVSLEVGREARLKLVLCPTPRWPDLLVVYSPSDRLLFTSKLFSAHVRCGPFTVVRAHSLLACTMHDLQSQPVHPE